MVNLMNKTRIQSLPLRHGIGFLVALLLFLSLPQASNAEYTIQSLNDGKLIRLKYDGFVFATINERTNGAVVVQPRPDSCFANAVGTSWYLNPFLRDNINPRGGTIRNVTPRAAGIDLIVDGTITQGTNNRGNYSVHLRFKYNAAAQQTSAEGFVDLVLDDPLFDLGTDLNLCMVGSNLLTSVPLQTGGLGETGDMRKAFVGYDDCDATPTIDDSPGGDDFFWDPKLDPIHRPLFFAEAMSIDTLGNVNVVDNLTLGGAEQIKMSNKPAVEVVYADADCADIISFDGRYDRTLENDPQAENIRMVPQVRQGRTLETIFEFTIAMRSSVSFNAPQAVTHHGTAGDDLLNVDITGMKEVIISTGPGNDRINIIGTPERDLVLRLKSGKGDDIVRCDHISRRSNFLGLIDLGTGNDSLRGRGTHPVWVYGGPGDDTLIGTSGGDILCGDFGKDLIKGSGGPDEILGGPADDILYGDAGSDLIMGDSGRDRIFGGKGSDILDGGEDSDKIFGGTQADILLGRHGKDYLETGTGADFAFGGDHDDILIVSGGPGSATAYLSGGKGNDMLNCKKENVRAYYSSGFGFDDVYSGMANPNLSTVRYVTDVVDNFHSRPWFEENAKEITKERFAELIENALTKIEEAGLAPPEF